MLAKDFIASLVKIDFDKNNQYDLKLEAHWESAITECRKHTYFILSVPLAAMEF
jgi:hypothetical protein